MTLLARLVPIVVMHGCLDASVRVCPDGESVCPDGTLCFTFEEPEPDLRLCVTPAQEEACRGVPERTACEAGFLGTCRAGVCLPIGCGNGTVDDPIYQTAEQCDDGNHLGHDGCSSTCQIETAQLYELRTGTPIPVAEHAMTFDASRTTMSMYGGVEYGGSRADELAFERSDDVWRKPFVSLLTPGIRTGHAIAYDHRRQRVVLFGGSDTEALGVGTWEWDGTTWSYATVLTAPAARVEHAMVYDARRAVVVLFGGRDGTRTFGDTWEWDGVAWVEVSGSPSPSPRTGHVLAYDAARGVVVMVGAEAPGAPVETWEYDADGWRPITTSAPSVGRDAVAAFDGVDRHVLLFGFDGIGPSTWTYDGAWRQHAPVVSPEGVTHAAATMMPTGRVLVLGGRQDPGDMNTVVASSFQWDGGAWQAEPPVGQTTPGTRSFTDAALDPLRRRVVLFGGIAMGDIRADTLEMRDAVWEERSPTTTPRARSHHVMAYDVTRRQVVMFGGLGRDMLNAVEYLGDTWGWDGRDWQPLASDVKAIARRASAMAHHTARGELLVFGGFDGSAMRDDLLVLSAGGWIVVPAAGPRPSARSGHAMAYDPIRRELVLFGGSSGQGLLRDTWVMGEDGAWREVSVGISPEPRYQHALTWDAARQRVVLTGGISSFDEPIATVWEWDGTSWTPVLLRLEVGATAGTTVSVPWLDGGGVLTLATTITDSRNRVASQLLQWRAPTVYESCTGVDRDRDGLVGCDDDDCWTSCTPLCPPSPPSAPGTCDLTSMCGDGTCNAALETCHLCPQDCGECPVVCGDFVCAPGEDCVGDCP